MLDDNQYPLVKEYCDLVAQKKAIEAQIKELDPQVRPMLEGDGLQVIGGEYTIECKAVAGRKTLDKKAMIADGHGDLLESYNKVGAPFTTLTVKVLG